MSASKTVAYAQGGSKYMAYLVLHELADLTVRMNHWQAKLSEGRLMVMDTLQLPEGKTVRHSQMQVAVVSASGHVGTPRCNDSHASSMRSRCRCRSIEH